MRSRLQNLYSAINSLGDTKLIQDRHEAQLDKLTQNQKTMDREKKELNEKLSKANDENREKDNVIKDIEKRVAKVQDKNKRFERTYMEKMDALEKEREEATEVKKKFTNENTKLLK